MSAENPVTVRELDEKLERQLAKYPTKWEVRFLIVVGLTATQLIPASEIAHAALGLLL